MYYQYGVRCFSKLLTNTSNVRYIRITTRSNFHISFYVPKRLILVRIKKEEDHFSKILEMRISFISSYRFMSYKHYFKQKMPMCEIKLNQNIT